MVGIWPLFQILSIRGLRDVFFIHGTSQGFYPVLFYILIIVFPYCLLTGFILPCAQRTLNGRGYPFTSGDLYITDSIGDIAGGFLFSLILVYFLKPFAIIAATSSLLFFIVFLLLYARRKLFFLGTSVLAVACFFAFCLNAGFERETLGPQYGPIVKYLESPYGRIVVTRETGQLTFWESGNPLYSESDVVESEEKIHYPLSQLGKVDDVLLISGGLGDTLKEVAKYKPAHVDYVEIDPALTSAGLEMGVIPRLPFLQISNMDARRFIRGKSGRYDAIIIDLPDPDTFQINRFFTTEFFGFAKKALKKDGVLCLGMNYSPNYIGEVVREKLSILYNSAKPFFRNALLIPGRQVYFIFSDGSISEDIPSLLKKKKISAPFIEGYFYGDVTPERIQEVREALGASREINKDFEPRLMGVVFQQWFAKHDSSPVYFIAGILLLVLVYFIFMKREEYVLFTTGFAAMGSEMLVIFVFQVLYGYVYLQIGLIVASSLLGLLPGAMAGKRWRRSGRMKLHVSEVAMISLLIIFLSMVVRFRNGTPSPSFSCFLFCLLFFLRFSVSRCDRDYGRGQKPRGRMPGGGPVGSGGGNAGNGGRTDPFVGHGIRRGVSDSHEAFQYGHRLQGRKG